MVTLGRRARSSACGVAADMALGEPPIEPHPLRAFGTLMTRIERLLYRDSRFAGGCYSAAGLAVGLGAGAMLRSTMLGVYLATAQRALLEAAAAIAAALDDGDVPLARALLPALVGRDPAELGAGEIARAVVESLAENTVDAIVAPACWGLIGGAPGALGYRAVNTMDACVGYRNDRYLRFGWASARLDDAANYLPARLTALLVAAVRPRSATAVWRAVRADAPGHPSPNAGVAEAAFAAAQGLRLGGTNHYGTRTERRAQLGSGRPPAPGDIAPAMDLCRDVTCALVALLGMVGMTR